MFNFFKSKREPICATYNVGQIIITIIDLDKQEHKSIFQGYIYRDDYYKCNKLVSALGVVRQYIKIYSVSKLFELDDGNLIPEHRIRFIKVGVQTEFLKEYEIPFGFKEYNKAFKELKDKECAG